jgi:hypothetical protein
MTEMALLYYDQMTALDSVGPYNGAAPSIRAPAKAHMVRRPETAA